MIQKSNSINPWYIFIGLSVLCALLWFFVQISKAKNVRFISKVDRQQAIALESEIDMNVVNKLSKRLIINEVELSTAHPYAKIKKDKDDQEKPKNIKVTAPTPTAAPSGN
jgi:hypothetical protein